MSGSEKIYDEAKVKSMVEVAATVFLYKPDTLFEIRMSPVRGYVGGNQDGGMLRKVMAKAAQEDRFDDKDQTAANLKQAFTEIIQIAKNNGADVTYSPIALRIKTPALCMN